MTFPKFSPKTKGTVTFAGTTSGGRVGIAPDGGGGSTDGDDDDSGDEWGTAGGSSADTSPNGNAKTILDNWVALDSDNLFGSMEDLVRSSQELSKKSEQAAQFHAIALALHNTGPISPFSTIHVAYD